MRAPPRSRVPARRGSNAVEFALLFPVFVFLLGGLVDYGWLFMTQSVATHAVHEAVRAGAVTLSDDDPVGVATAEVAQQLADSGVPVGVPTIDAHIAGAAPNAYLSLDVELPVTSPVGLVPLPATLHVSARMRLEDQS